MAKTTSRAGHPARQAVSATPAHTNGHSAIFATLLAAAALVTLAVPSVQPQSLGMDLVAACTGLAAAAAATGVLLARPASRRVSRLALAWAAFLAWALVSALASGRVWAALVGESTSRVGWMTLVALTALAFAAAFVSADVKAVLRRHAWWIVLAESILIFYQLLVTESASVGGLLPNSTYAGEALVLLLPWVLPDVSVTERWRRQLRYAAIVVTVGALAAVQSRAALLVAVAWCVWVIARRWNVPGRVKLVALVLLGTVTVAATAFVLPASVFDPDGTLPLGGRLAAWELSADALLERPLVGWGADSYWPAAASVRTLEKAADADALVFGAAATDPHNAFVWVTLSAGVVGLALFGWFLVEVVLRWRRVGASEDRPAAAWSLVGCLAIGMTAPIALHVLALFAIVLGASIAVTTRNSAEPETAGGSLRLALPVKTMLAACAIVAIVLSLNALTRARYEEDSAQRSPALAAGAVSASRLWSLDAHLAYRASIQAGWAAQAMPGAGWEREDLDALERAFSADRRNPFYALERAKALGTYGFEASAVDAAFAAAFDRYPAYPTARAEYAIYLAQAGRVAEAQQQLDAIAPIKDADPSRISAVEAAEAAIAAQGQ